MTVFGGSTTWPRGCGWSTTAWRNSAGFMTASAAIARRPHESEPACGMKLIETSLTVPSFDTVSARKSAVAVSIQNRHIVYHSQERTTYVNAVSNAEGMK